MDGDGGGAVMSAHAARRPGGREVRIDRAVYAVEDGTKTYRYLRRNPDWQDLDPEENERNKRQLDGYTRIFPDGQTKVFSYRPPYTTKRAGQRTGCHPSSHPGP